MSGPKRKAGLLWPDVEGCRRWLTQRGYTPGTVRNMLKDLGQLGLWLSAEGLRREDLNEERVAAFLSARRDAGRRRIPGPHAMMPLLSYLREIGAAPERAASVTPLGELMTSYRSWMVQERGLALTTVLRYENTARRFLQESSAGGVFAPGGSDRGGHQRILAAGIRPGVVRVGEGQGGRAAFGPAFPLSAGPYRVGAGCLGPCGGWMSSRWR